jgi:hypothetical protein
MTNVSTSSGISYLQCKAYCQSGCSHLNFLPICAFVVQIVDFILNRPYILSDRVFIIKVSYKHLPNGLLNNMPFTTCTKYLNQLMPELISLPTYLNCIKKDEVLSIPRIPCCATVPFAFKRYTGHYSQDYNNVIIGQPHVSHFKTSEHNVSCFDMSVCSCPMITLLHNLETVCFVVQCNA